MFGVVPLRLGQSILDQVDVLARRGDTICRLLLKSVEDVDHTRHAFQKKSTNRCFPTLKIAGRPLTEVLWRDALNFLQKLRRTACKPLGQADVRRSDAPEPHTNRGTLLKEKRRRPFGRRRSLPKTGKDYTCSIRQAQARAVLIYRAA